MWGNHFGRELCMNVKCEWSYFEHLYLHFAPHFIALVNKYCNWTLCVCRLQSKVINWWWNIPSNILKESVTISILSITRKRLPDQFPDITHSSAFFIGTFISTHVTTKRGPQTPLGCYMRNGTTSDPVIIAIVPITILSTLDQLWHSTILTKVFATSLNVETFNRWVIRKGWCNFIEPQVYFWPYCSPVDQTSRQLSYPFQKAYSPMNKASDGENVRAKCRKLKKNGKCDEWH